MVVVDGQGFPLGSSFASASPAEVKLIEETLEQVKVPRRCQGRPRKRMRRLIADKAYDSDQLRKRLKAKKIDLICPHRRNQKNAKLQDNRKTAALPQEVESRTHLCLAGKLPATSCALGSPELRFTARFSIWLA
jgi:transposase